MESIFHLQKFAETCLLEINLNNVRLNIENGNNIQIPSEILKQVPGQTITISGRAPLWLYMYTALQLHLAGTKGILLKQAQESAVNIVPVAKSKCSDEQFAVISTFEKTLICEYLCTRNKKISPADLSDCLDALPEKEEKYDTLVLSGKMPIWLAGAAAVDAYKKGWRNIECFVPQEGCTVAITPAIHSGGKLPQLKSPGIIIGIIGDPNSGKSVFSELLEQSGNFAGERLWRFDCDYAAPTPNWYLDMLKQGKKEEGKELRLSYKRKWIPGAEEELVSDLNNMRKYIPIIIADLPGGLHKDGISQRIPPGREVLLKSVDCFIIVAKKDSLDTGVAWQHELNTIGKANNIVLTVYSGDYKSPTTSLTFRDGYWRTNGLSRDAKPASVEIKKQLWQLVMDSIRSREIPGKSELDNK